MLLTFYFSDTNSLEFLALVAENRKLEEKVFTLLKEKEDLIRKNRDLKEKAQSQSHMRCDTLKCNNKIDDLNIIRVFRPRFIMLFLNFYVLLMNLFSIQKLLIA